MNCLVTGGAGFIGHNLIQALLGRGDRVRVLDDFSTGKRENLERFKFHVEVVEGDLRCQDTVCKATKDIEVIFHQGALASVPLSVQDPVANHEINVEGTFNVLNAARQTGVRRVVYASSAAIYGENGVLPKQEAMPPCPLSPYAAAKLMGETYCQVFARSYGLETVCLRYFNVFGAGQDPNSAYAAAIPAFISAFLNGGAISIYGDGEQSRDFVHIEDIVQANLLAAEASLLEGVFNIARGSSSSLNQIIAYLREITGRSVELEYGPARPGDIRHSQADISMAQKVLGYGPKVNVKEGLKKSLNGYCK